MGGGFLGRDIGFALLEDLLRERWFWQFLWGQWLSEDFDLSISWSDKSSDERKTSDANMCSNGENYK